MSRPPATVPILLAAAVAVAGAGFEAVQAPGPAPSPGTIRVATWNVHRFQATEPDGRVTLEDIRATLDRMDPHVVGLQESEMGRATGGAFDAPGWLADRLGLHVVYGPPTRDQVYGVALLSAFPVLESQVVALPSEGVVERVATKAVLEGPDGPLPVVVAHLSVIEEPDHRARQAEVLVDLLEGEDEGFLVGDMNTPAERGERALEVLEGGFRDAWREAGHPAGSGKTAFGADPSVRIDHVWVVGDGPVEGASTWGRAGISDHRAVMANVSLPGPGADAEARDGIVPGNPHP